MKPLNLRVILLLGGILLITLAFQVFQRYTVEKFITAGTTAATTPPATTPPVVPPPAGVTSPAVTTPVGTPGSSGVTYYTIPVGNDQSIKLEIPVQAATGVTVQDGPVPVSTTPPIK